MVVLDVFSSFDGVTYKVHFRVLQYLQWLFSSGHVDFMTCFMVQWFIHVMIHYFMYHASSSVYLYLPSKKWPFFGILPSDHLPLFSLQKPLSHRRWNAKTVGKHATLPPWDCDKNEGKGCKFVNGWTPRIFQIFQILPAWMISSFLEHTRSKMVSNMCFDGNSFSHKLWFQWKNRTRTKQDALHCDARLGKFVVFPLDHDSGGVWGPNQGLALSMAPNDVHQSQEETQMNMRNIAFHSSTKKHAFADPSEIVISQQRPRKWLLLKPVSYSCEGHIGPSTKRNKRHKSLFDNKCHGVAIDLVWICLEGIVKNI